jgi:hypothetical protein
MLSEEAEVVNIAIGMLENINRQLQRCSYIVYNRMFTAMPLDVSFLI